MPACTRTGSFLRPLRAGARLEGMGGFNWWIAVPSNRNPTAKQEGREVGVVVVVSLYVQLRH